MMKQFFLPIAIAFATPLAASSIAPKAPSTASESPKIETNTEKAGIYPYIGVGVSSIAIVPYGANIGMGGRYFQQSKILGLDASVNYTSTFISQYIFGKVLMPVYLQPDTIESSYFFGPFVTYGYNHQFEKLDKRVPKGEYMLAITGVTFGKNFRQGKRISFWQLSGNLHRFQSSPEGSLKSLRWPTITFQYGVGF